MERVSVREIMKRKVVTIGAGDRLSTAEDIMRLGGVRHMPVVNMGQLVGVVSERDLLRASPSSLEDLEPATGNGEDRRALLSEVRIEQVMSRPAIVVPPDALLPEAAHLMVDRKIGCLPVIDAGGRMVGLVTSGDVLEHLAILADAAAWSGEAPVGR